MSEKNGHLTNKTPFIEEMFNKEIFISEKLRASILIGLLGLEAVFLLIIYFVFSEEYIDLFKTHIAIYAILIFTTIIIIYEFFVHYFLVKKVKLARANPRFFGYFNSFWEVTLLSALLVYIVEYSGQTFILLSPATLTYFIFIVLSTFRLDFKLSVFTGVLAAVEFVFISKYYASSYGSIHVDVDHPRLLAIQYHGQGLIMMITGVASGYVAELIKKKLIIAWKNIQKKNEVIDLFGQQISPEIAENILNRRDELFGARKKVTIMFLDIRQFTPFVEKHLPEEVVAYLNTLFSFMIDIVQSHHGVINQFLGDGFMATFGAPVTLENSSRHAVQAAEEILERLEEECRKGTVPETKVGIGLHYDEAVTGNIGSSVRKQYSITGKVVIMASRIEQLNKKFNTSLLISKEVYEQLDDEMKKHYEWLGEAKVKGSEKLVSLYKLVEKNKSLANK
jgi:adenylate cyclase